MITKYTCSNGVRIVQEKIPTVRSVAIGIWINTGSRHEDKMNNGISHFLEHMLFKGTKTRSAKEIAESFDRIGGHVNAFTSKEYTCYYAKVLDNHAAYALEILADMFFNSTFDPIELEKEKNVVYEEIKMYEDTPDDIVHDLVTRATYGDYSLAYPILGTKERLETFTSETLHQYMKENYTPDKIVISIAGNVDELFIKEVEKYFHTYEGASRKLDVTTPTFHRETIIRQKDTEQSHLCMAFPGLPVGDKDIYSLVTLNNILGGSMSSHLFQKVREQRGLAYSVFSYHSSYEDTGSLTVYAGTGNEQLEELCETIQETLETLKAEGITSKELENSREQLKGNLMLGLESTNGRMSRNGKNELLLGSHRSLDEIVESIDAVSEASVNDMISRTFTDEFATALVSPSGENPMSQA